MPKIKPIISHTEILCLAISAVARKLHECDEIVDRCDNVAAREMAEDARKLHSEIWLPKLDALKELYRIETGTNFD